MVLNPIPHECYSEVPPLMLGLGGADRFYMDAQIAYGIRLGKVACWMLWSDHRRALMESN